ncbi:MAG TPA: DNA-processing protein DprA, partial [Myxococcota bacterium]|nr:DNA-processing protein DprA [Myxococcota bacterium]
MDLKDIVGHLHDDNEALMLLSLLNFEAKDWPTLAKLGKPKALLESELISRALSDLFANEPALIPILRELRSLLDMFYEQDGSLLTMHNCPESRLFRAPKAPLLFYVRFKMSLANIVPAVAIVGSRAASLLGQKQSAELATELARQNFNVISGGALGIDSAAHRGALKANGSTVIVSGVLCSLRDDELSMRMRANYSDRCAIVYPFGPFIPQQKYMFVERNRFVAAMADALIVVQGQKGSGTLHTVKDAKRLSIPIFAVPGSLDDPLSLVPNMLISSGEARAIVDFEQDFRELFVLKSAHKRVR